MNLLAIRNSPVLFIAAILGLVLLSAFTLGDDLSEAALTFPYLKEGLSERQAAAHLLNRFTWGEKPGEIEQLQSMGLEKWFEGQLNGKETEEKLNRALQGNDAVQMTTGELKAIYKRPAQVLRLAIADGVISKDSVAVAGKKEYRAKLVAYMRKKGIRSERELIREMVSQKILRAVYSQNQLNDVLTDFWFNHFNVSFTKPNCGQFIPSMERDVIRPRVAGKFEELLIATAQSPAMLMYLDNFSSVGEGTTQTPLAARRMNNRGGVKKPVQKKKVKGLNENYAREVMELHTLGVDGGYTQEDVTQAARILTGWTILPLGEDSFGNGYQKLKQKAGERALRARGFVEKDGFLFTPNRHDQGEKIFLGKRFPAGGGYEEGVAMLQMLARNPSAAQFISRKLAIRFVSDDPPASLVSKMTKTFLETGGSIREVLKTMVGSQEFWSTAAVREKTKSPFELTVSALRSMNAEVTDPYPLFTWINRMGQPLYSYQAPTGFPDKGQYWINTGSLLNRMNFGLALSDGRIKGVSFDLLSLNHDHEPESAENALMVYSNIMLPERDADATTKRLAPLLNDPKLQQKVSDAASGTEVENLVKPDSLGEVSAAVIEKPIAATERYRLSQVVGILIGSPEFQRR